MPGSPIKRARKMGAPVPNIGDRPPMYPSASRPLESDAELNAIAKRVLRDKAEGALEDRDCISAARALAEVTRAQETKVTLGLESLSVEELDKVAEAARKVLAS